MANEDAGDESEDEREVEPPSSHIDSEDETGIEGPSLPYLSVSPSPTPNPLANVFQPMPPSVVGGTAANARPELTHKQRYAKESHARRRAARQNLHPPEDRQLKSVSLKKRLNLDTIPTPIDAEGLNAASTGWTGLRISTNKENFTLEELTAVPYNLRHVQWDGK